MGLRCAVALALCAAAPDPLAGYYGNTLVWLAADGTDAGHLWLAADHSYLLFASIPARRGQATIQGVDAQGRPRLCLQHRAALTLPPAFATPAPAQPTLAPGLCLRLARHVPGDRWPDPDRPGRAGFVLLEGQR